MVGVDCRTAAVRGITTADLEGCKDIRASVIGVCSYRHAVVGVDCAQEARGQIIVDQDLRDLKYLTMHNVQLAPGARRERVGKAGNR